MNPAPETRLYRAKDDKFITVNSSLINEDFLRRNGLERVQEPEEEPVFINTEVANDPIYTEAKQRAEATMKLKRGRKPQTQK